MAGSVLIVEGNPHGHRLGYVRLVARRAMERGLTPHVLTSHRTPEAPEWAVHLSEIVGQLTVHQTTSPRDLAEVAAAARRVGAVRTVIPDADGFLRQVVRSGWRGPGRLSLLVMRPDAEPRRNRLLSTAARLTKRALMSLARRRRGVDEFALRSPLRTRSEGLVRWVPDPVEIDREAIAALELPLPLREFSGAEWVGVFGYVDERKNLSVVADAVERAGLGLLVAGIISPEAERRAAPLLARLRENGRFLWFPGPLEDAFFDALINRADCVVAAHSNEGPSGIVARAAVLGRPLVLAGASSLRQDAACLPAQAVWVPLTAPALAEALARSVRAPRSFEPPVADAVEFADALLSGGGR
ncbi:hypothetical protein ABCS02_22200 [Microbacterium sp. X-17]|uniref:glycosyltransferase n=1 Tax=Microbacterium sp. X-17 TaxID=3144404 RepID=UPI0031F536F0